MLFLPEDTNERGGRMVSLTLDRAEITEADEARGVVKIEGLAVDDFGPDTGAIVELTLIGNCVRIPRVIGVVRITIEEA